MRKPLFVLRHDREYYWGLTLLVASCLTLVWALWRDAFKPPVFLAGLLAFSWGYALLYRSDLQERLTAIEDELAELRTELAKVAVDVSSSDEGETKDESPSEPPSEPVGEPEAGGDQALPQPEGEERADGGATS